MTVVAAFELYDLIAACIATRQTDSTHARFCTAAYHAHHIHIWYHALYQLRHFYLQLCWRTKGCGIGYFVLYRFHDRFIRMSEDHWPPGIDVIYVLISIYIIEIGSFRFLYKYRCAAYALESTHWGINTTGYALLRTLKKLFAFAHKFF